jgi:hypothetical protein
MSTHITKTIQIIKVIALALILAVGFQYAAAQGAWSASSSNPPSGNTDAPINVGDSQQNKLGSLFINTGSNPWAIGLTVFGNSIFHGNVGVGTVNPTTKLDVNGDVRTKGIYITNTGNAPAGSVLTLSDPATGNTVWGPAGSTSNSTTTIIQGEDFTWTSVNAGEDTATYLATAEISSKEGGDGYCPAGCGSGSGWGGGDTCDTSGALTYTCGVDEVRTCYDWRGKYSHNSDLWAYLYKVQCKIAKVPVKQ